MADAQTTTGVLGHLPPWPRKPLNASVIADEQAYRKRKGLPELSEQDVEALKAGVQMSWEGGDGAPVATPAAPSPGAGTPAAAPATGGLSPAGAELVAAGRKWSKSAIAAEQARRTR